MHRAKPILQFLLLFMAVAGCDAERQDPSFSVDRQYSFDNQTTPLQIYLSPVALGAQLPSIPPIRQYSAQDFYRIAVLERPTYFSEESAYLASVAFRMRTCQTSSGLYGANFKWVVPMIGPNPTRREFSAFVDGDRGAVYTSFRLIEYAEYGLVRPGVISFVDGPTAIESGLQYLRDNPNQEDLLLASDCRVEGWIAAPDVSTWEVTISADSLRRTVAVRVQLRPDGSIETIYVKK